MVEHRCDLFDRSARRSWEARFGQPFDPCLCLDQRSVRDSGQTLGRHSRAARHTRKCCRTRSNRHGYVEFYEDRGGSRGHVENAGIEANRQTRRRRRRSRFCSVRWCALDHRCQYPSRWWFEALTDNVRDVMQTKPSEGNVCQPNAFLDSESLCNRSKIFAQDRLSPIWPPPSVALAGKNPIVWLGVGTLFSPV